MTSIAAPRVAGDAARTSFRKPAFASARATLRRSFRGLAALVELERNRPGDPYLQLGMTRS